MDLDPGGFVSEALRKLFRSGKEVVTYQEVEECGLSYIRDVDEAPIYAYELASEIGPDNGYVDYGNERFVKQIS